MIQPTAVYAIPSRRILSTASAALYLGIGRNSVRNLILEGALPAVRIRRRVFVHLAELDKFVASLPVRYTPAHQSALTTTEDAPTDRLPPTAARYPVTKPITSRKLRHESATREHWY